MYYEYWGLNKAPFDNVPDPSMYVESHSSVENAIAETIFAIEEGNECIAVIVGDVGSGKTLSLRLILDSLQPDRYRIAFVTNPDISFVELLREIIGQLTDKQCESKKKIELLEIFNKILFETAEVGKKVVLFIDEANAMAGHDLESLRLLTNMQDDSRNLLTIILAGQIELARKLEHPARANLYQRIGTYNRISKIESIERLRDYVETRIRLSGGRRMPFTDDALSALWVHSEHGVPRLVNKFCKLCLKAGETNGFRVLDENVVNQIGERFTRSPHFSKTGILENHEERQLKKLDKPADDKPKASQSPQKIEKPQNERHIFERPSITKPIMEESPRPPQKVEIKQPSVVELKARPKPQSDLNWETDIGSYRVQIIVPVDLMNQASLSTSEKRIKLAGTLAAQTLQRHPQLAFSTSHDPVALWSEIRKSILTVIDQESATARAQ
jgi:type II secretory pathway predicted ATPase ExeA